MLIQISLQFIPKGSIVNQIALDLVQVMAWYQTGNSPDLNQLCPLIDNDAIFCH